MTVNDETSPGPLGDCPHGIGPYAPCDDCEMDHIDGLKDEIGRLTRELEIVKACHAADVGHCFDCERKLRRSDAEI